MARSTRNVLAFKPVMRFGKRWVQAEPWTVRPGRLVQVMVAGRDARGNYRFAVGKITRLLKGGLGVEFDLNGVTATRDTRDVMVTASKKRAGRMARRRGRR